ncbi:MAG: HlyD family efflux transporter periplasmic adaptor subunit, partial [Bdellovibrionota bacterium]
PLSVELRELEEERTFLERQRNNLYVFADIDGIVGSVNFKRGERAPSFASLVTISPDSPTFVQGFVNEALRTNVHPGSHVRISSLTNFGSSVEGKVISVGARFVEVPARISAAAHGVPVWGREVMIEIPKESNIILGEKVQIAPITSLLPALVAHADEEDAPVKTKEAPAPAHVKVPASLADKTSFEASGAVYLPDLKKYLVVSDDTDDSNSPWLFLMSEEGEVEERPLVIPGVKQLNDMESVSMAGDYLYVMTSLTEKKGKPAKLDRNLFVRTKRNGVTLSGTQSLNMGKLLRKLIKKSEHPLLQAMVEDGIDKLEVEAHDIRDGALYIGLKAPQTSDNASLILRVPNVDDLFSPKANEVELEVWKTVKFEENDGSTYRISDLTFVGNTAYFTTSCKSESCGGVWSLGENEAKPKLLRKFTQDSPEGIAYNAAKNLFMVTFDLGSRGSKFTTLTGPRSPRQ